MRWERYVVVDPGIANVWGGVSSVDVATMIEIVFGETIEEEEML